MIWWYSSHPNPPWFLLLCLSPWILWTKTPATSTSIQLAIDVHKNKIATLSLQTVLLSVTLCFASHGFSHPWFPTILAFLCYKLSQDTFFFKLQNKKNSNLIKNDVWLLDQHYCMMQGVGLSRSARVRWWQLQSWGCYIGYVVTGDWIGL